MKQIPLTGSNGIGKFVLVDDEDFEKMKDYYWNALSYGNTIYAQRAVKKKERLPIRTIMFHRFLLGVTDPNIIIDHKDKNGLNCQKNNLRTSSKGQNMSNRSSSKTSTSKYLGVSLVNTNKGKNKYWVARIRHNKTQYTLGHFPHTIEGEILAAKAYDKKALELHNEFANLNFK